MTDDAQDEIELDDRQTAWVRGGTNTKMGHALLTSDRILFFQQKWNGAAGGVLGVVLTDRLQKRADAGGPLFELPLEEVVRVERQKKLLNKDRIALSTATDTFLLNEGWKRWAPLLRETLAERHQRTVVDDGEDAFRVEAG